MTIKNELTINYAGELYKMLAETLLTKEELRITIPTPLPVDVTFIQILYAFLAKCKSLNKKVFFEINGQNEFYETLKQIGYNNLVEVLKTENNGEKNV